MPATTEDTIALLHRVPAFSTLGAEDLAQVAAVAVPRQFSGGEVVFREGDASDTCYIVRSGRARAIREHPDGRSITLANFGPGEIFGELAMFDDELRSATVEAIEDTEAIGILGGDMRRLLREHPDIAVKLISALGRRLRETNERLARQSFESIPAMMVQVVAPLDCMPLIGTETIRRLAEAHLDRLGAIDAEVGEEARIQDDLEHAHP